MESVGRLMDFERLFYKGKRVLVTGHTGFKGSWLCRILANAGAIVTGYGLEPSTEPNLFSISGLDGRMNSVIGDIRDFEHLKEVFDTAQPEIVFHLAAQPIVRDSYKEPRYTYETNVMGTVNVMALGGRRPLKPSSSRSFSVKALLLLNQGFLKRLTPLSVVSLISVICHPLFCTSLCACE